MRKVIIRQRCLWIQFRPKKDSRVARKNSVLLNLPKSVTSIVESSESHQPNVTNGMDSSSSSEWLVPLTILAH